MELAPQLPSLLLHCSQLNDLLCFEVVYSRLFGCGYDIKLITLTRENWVGQSVGVCQALRVKHGPHLTGLSLQRWMCPVLAVSLEAQYAM